MIRVALIDGNQQIDDYKSSLYRLTNLSIAAVVDADESRAAWACDELQTDFTASTFDHLLDQCGELIDAVLVHSPIPRRCELVCRAAQAGKHILVASPMARTTDEADTMVEACESAGVTLMVGQATRFMPFQRTVYQRLISGKLGAPGLLRIHHWSASINEWTDELPADDESLPLSLLTGDVDLSCWFFRAAPITVYAVSPSTQQPIGSSQDIQVHLGFPCGGMALIDCSISTGSKCVPYYSLSMIGSTGAAYADDHHNTNLWFHDNGITGLTAGLGTEHVRLMLQEFADALSAHRDPVGDGNDGRRAIAVARAALNSLTSRCVVHLVGERYEL